MSADGAGLPPLRLTPLFKQRSWGGGSLLGLLGLPDSAADDPIGEAWILSDLKGTDRTRVDGGAFEGSALRDLIANPDVRSSLMGRATSAPDGSFPLLIKFLDARENLSVQTHPRDRVGTQEIATAKHELWVVLRAEKGARVYRGFRGEVTKDEIARRARDGSLLDVLVSHEVHRGDAIWLPSGTVHALGAGLVVAEIQTPSDTTYRLWDWNRNDPARPLHIEQAVEAAAVGPAQELREIRHVEFDARPASGAVRVEALHSASHFDVDVITAGANASWEIADRGVPVAWTVLDGGVTLTAFDSEIRRGSACVIPAVHGTLRASASGTGASILVATPR